MYNAPNNRREQMKRSNAIYAIQYVANDKSASDLLRFICAKGLSKDPCDMAAELEYAANLFNKLADATLADATAQ